MAFLLRVELPDVPGSLGAVATSLGTAGADIHAIEIVEHPTSGTAIDDVLLELPPHVLPDSLVSACQRLEGVRVLWISRYNAGASLRLDLEVVEVMTQHPRTALARLVDLVPETFRCDWALAVRITPGDDEQQPATEVLHATKTAPDLPADVRGWPGDTQRAHLLPAHPAWEGTVLAAAPVGGTLVVLGRRGGPDVLESELARFGHLCALAATITAP